MTETTDTTVTTKDVASVQWLIDDDIVRLREWALGATHELVPTCARALIGTAAGCAVRVREHARPRRVSGEHALLERRDSHWYISDNHSKNGLFLDGAKRESCLLVPGTEIGLGRTVTLIAESPRLIELRAMLARMIGWTADRAASVDLALRAIRLAATQRSVLVLQGEGNLVPLVEALHDLLLPGRPFVVCHPQRAEIDAGQPEPQRLQDGVAALRAAAGGTVCLLYGMYPRDFVAMLLEARRPDCRAQLVVCSDRAVQADTFAATPIVLPAIRVRRKELDRLIDEYMMVAAGRLSVEHRKISWHDRTWIRAELSGSLADIQRATLRLTALRHGGGMAAGAMLLGLTERGMRKWFREQHFEDHGW